MPRRGSTRVGANHVVGSGVANAVSGSYVFLRGRDPFSLIELAILALDIVTFFLVATVPFARDLAGELATAESKGERERQRDGPKENGKGGRDDLRRDTQFLKRHEGSE